jgi:hypothetical protein
MACTTVTAKTEADIWTIRHDTVEAAIYHCLAYLRQRVRHVHGAGNLFDDDIDQRAQVVTGSPRRATAALTSM